MKTREPHFLSVLSLGMSASIWAVMGRDFLMPVCWLVFLSLFVLLDKPGEFRLFLRRFVKMGMALLSMSILQLVFRRSGTVLIHLGEFPLIFESGFREAVLLWVRFMILFTLAYVMARVSVFQFLYFTNRFGLSLNFSLLLLNALKLIPSIFQEAKRVLWFLRFRGIRFRPLPIGGKWEVVKQLMGALLMRVVTHVFYSAHVLELRGYGQNDPGKIKADFPVHIPDICLLVLVFGLNGLGVYLKFFQF